MFTYYINGVQVKTAVPMTDEQVEQHKILLINHKYNTRTNWDSYRWRSRNVKSRN